LLVLGHHAGVAWLLDMVDLRHPAHHLLVPELPERLKVEMPKPLVPMLGLIISTSGEARGLSYLHVKHVQPVVPTVDLCEKAITAVPDTEADDGVLEGRDAVDPMEWLVLAILTHEHNGPDAADLQHGLIAKLDRVPDAVIQVSEVPDTPGHVVHGATIEVPHSSLSSSEPLPSKPCARDSSMWSRAKEVSSGMEWV
jgi:hypothetical protein